MSEHDVILEAIGLSVEFPVRSPVLRRTVGEVQAVTDVSISVRAGQTIALVGESGCGKSTLGHALASLVAPTRGTVRYRGEAVDTSTVKGARALRRDVQVIFQDSYASLNPRRTVRQLLREPWEIHRDLVPRRRWDERSIELLGQVGLSEADLDKYPHQFSGGQQQRIAIARALALEPKVIVCDESVSSLDVSLQGQIIRLLQRLQEELGLAYVFISHDLAVVRMIASEVAVMYLGRIVEQGSVDAVFDSPVHPYTRALIAAVPVGNPTERRERAGQLEGELPSPINPPSGCRFRTRCPLALPICSEIVPPLVAVAPDHDGACHVTAPAVEVLAA